MLKTILLSAILLITLQAQEVKLSAEQLSNWQIKTSQPQSVKTLPLGEFIVEVATPPSLLTTISLPFEANVKKLFVANFQEVKNGEILAEVTGTQWIATQQDAIANAIALTQQTDRYKRKAQLCKEKIIPQKECVNALADLKTQENKLAASKALLRSYGASKTDIDTLIHELKLSSTVALRSPIKGRIISLGAVIGKSSNSTDALFVIQQEGFLWLEADIEASRTTHLNEGQKVSIELSSQRFDTMILQLSPMINPANQTRHVRFLVPHTIKLLSGLRTSAKISYTMPTLKIAKNSIINHEGSSIVFVKTAKGFNSVKVKIVGEEIGYYFVEKSKELEGEIATTSVAILKNLLGEEDE
ncbi:MAG: efflux RND transporter periplasmic adaptor subunit [Campylobacterales bacterium]|nr:efflux RND transporter periplasmic adaptor subunit [Campylobacterales bacterium]